MCFDLIYSNDICGAVSVTKEGLYYKIQCRCDLPTKGIYHMIIQSDENKIDLGICVPKDGRFGIDTRIPTRNINTDSVRFVLIEKESDSEKSKFLLESSMPFPYLEQLETAYLCSDKKTIAIRGDQRGI